MKRQQKLLLLLKNKGDWMTGKDLAQAFSVSDRTIRSDIAQLNKAYALPLIESDLRLGYRLLTDHFNDLASQMISQDSQSPLTRQTSLLKNLLVVHKKIKVHKVLDQLHISESLLDKDIQAINQLLTSYPDLHLTKQRGWISLEGSEHTIRSLYKDLLVKETQDNFLNLNKMAKLYQNFDLLHVTKILEDCLKKNDYEVNELSYLNLILHIGISLDRMLSGNPLASHQGPDKIDRHLEYQIAREFYQAVSKTLPIQVVDSEVVSLSLLLLGQKGQSLCPKQDKQVQDMVVDTIQFLKEKFSIDFSMDQNLMVGLSLHLSGLLHRLAQGLTSANVYLEDIKNHYPLIFELAIVAANYLQDRYPIHFDESEIGYVAIHLGLAYDRLSQKNKIKTILIFPKSNPLVDNLSQKLTSLFGKYLHIIDQPSYFEEKDISRQNPDLILCTKALHHSLAIPTVTISPFLSSEDESNILSTIQTLEMARLKKEFSSTMLSIMGQEFFICHQSFTSKEEVIDQVCQKLLDYHRVTGDFKSSLLAREALSDTSFAQEVAVPHALDSQTVLLSTLAIVVLDEPLLWGRYPVRLIFFLAIEPEDRKTMPLFFQWLTKMMEEGLPFLRLGQETNYKDFISFLL